MFKFKIDFEKTKNKYAIEAKKYLNDHGKTEGLLKKAILKAKNNKGSLGDTWDKLQLFINLIKAYTKGEYRNISTSTILTVIGAIIYFVSPIDIVPDFLIGMGILDDAAVIGYTVKKISEELDHFKIWLKETPLTQDSPLDY